MLRPVEKFTAIKPRGNMVLVEPVVGKQRTEVGIELPEGYDEGPNRLRVLAVGPGNRSRDGKSFVDMDLKPGDIVGHGRTGMTNVSFNGRQLMLLNADAILCVFDEAQISNQIKVVK